MQEAKVFQEEEEEEAAEHLEEYLLNIWGSC